LAKGSYRLIRDRILEELVEHDPEWAAQLRALRSTNPQAFRKGMLRADVVLASKLGRPTSLSMRRKRFGGEEDPVLVRRVLELRKHHMQAERRIALPKPQWLREHGPIEPGEVEADPDAPVSGGRFSERAAARVAAGEGHGTQGAVGPAADMALADKTRRGLVQDRTPELEHGNVDASPLGQGLQGRSPSGTDANLGPAQGGRIDARTPAAAVEDPAGAVAKGNRLRGRGSRFDADLGPAQGNRLRSRGPEDRPDLSAAEAAAAPDPGLLKQSMAAIKAKLASGALDAHLDALEAAERAGKGRKGLLSAIAARR
jgi:hypothetical protein